jgi:HD-like signal output (HDOD) protein
MPKFKFHPNSEDQKRLWAWDITAESEEAAWELVAEMKRASIEELKKFITIKQIDNDTEHAS